MQHLRAEELCESRDGRPGLPVPRSPYDLYGRKATLEKEEEDAASTATMQHWERLPRHALVGL